MKVIFEFDTESENFNSIELERHKQADDMAKALGEILKKKHVVGISMMSGLLFLLMNSEKN